LRCTGLAENLKEACEGRRKTCTGTAELHRAREKKIRTRRPKTPRKNAKQKNHKKTKRQFPGKEGNLFGRAFTKRMCWRGRRSCEGPHRTRENKRSRGKGEREGGSLVLSSNAITAGVGWTAKKEKTKEKKNGKVQTNIVAYVQQKSLGSCKERTVQGSVQLRQSDAKRAVEGKKNWIKEGSGTRSGSLFARGKPSTGRKRVRGKN